MCMDWIIYAFLSNSDEQKSNEMGEKERKNEPISIMIRNSLAL